MYRAKKIKTSDRKEFYRVLGKLMENQVVFEKEWLPQLANAAALLGHQLDEINWVGFYLYKDGELILGPFQGKPACTHIFMGSGVCGTAAQKRETVVVYDVNEFPGHIACDEASRSEIVIPLIDKEGNLRGVLDIDSPVIGRFEEIDREGLEEIARLIVENVEWGLVKF